MRLWSRLMVLSAPLAYAVLLALPVGAASQEELLALDELIARARTIVVATVSSRKAEWESYGASRLIVSKVTLEIEQRLKGSPPRTMVVEVLGGTIGNDTQRLSHVPEFRVNDRDVLFLNDRARAASPVVGSDQGRFRVLHDGTTGVARVLTSGFEPLQSAAQIGTLRTASARTLSSALSLDDFVTLVRDRIRVLEARR